MNRTFDFKRLLNVLRAEPPSFPFYAYDLQGIARNVADLQQALPQGFQIFYSMKANPHHAVLKLMAQLGAWVDVSSMGEFERAREAGFSPQQMSFVGPGKSEVELSLCVNENIHCVVVESRAELELLGEIARARQRQVRVCLRVNPARYLNYLGRELLTPPSHFGIDEEQLAEVVSTAHAFTDIVGLHFFLHSQFLSADFLASNFGRFIKIADQFQSQWGRPLSLINLGGGFGIPYFAGQTELDLARLQSELVTVMRSDAACRLQHSRFFVESGRFLAGSAGVFVTRVLYRKVSRGQTYLVCDGGLTQHLAATGVGQIIRKPFPITVLRTSSDGYCVARAEEAVGQSPVSVVGPSCYSLDVLAQNISLPFVEPGDLLCFGQSGAYGPSFSPQEFLTRPFAREMILPS